MLEWTPHNRDEDADEQVAMAAAGSGHGVGGLASRWLSATACSHFGFGYRDVARWELAILPSDTQLDCRCHWAKPTEPPETLSSLSSPSFLSPNYYVEPRWKIRAQD
jgi:hypothetical protein